MATLTQRNREVAYEMFAAGEDSEKIARRIRRPVGTVRALRANWTRNLSSTSSSTSSTPSASSQPVVVHINSRRLRSAIESGQPVQLVINV